MQRLTHRSLAPVVYRSDLESTFRSMRSLAEELLRRQREHFQGQTKHRIRKKGPATLHYPEGDSEQLVLAEAQAEEVQADHEADAPEQHDKFPEATQEELFQDILRKHLFEHMQGMFEVGAWYSAPPISQRLTSHSTHLGLRLNTQLADVDGDLVPVTALRDVDHRDLAPLDDVARPNLNHALSRVSMVHINPGVFDIDEPDPQAEGSHFFFQIINTKPSRGKFVQLLSGVGKYQVGDTVVALQGAWQEGDNHDEASVNAVS